MIPLWKRVLDLICIAVSLPVVLPVSVFISIGIKLMSRGPILFRQERIGYQGKPFVCLKFRSLKENAPSEKHQDHLRNLIKSGAPLTKLDVVGDPRLIPLGRLLRASGLDELPQLINVLKGEMTLVGPRPCTPGEYSLYLPEQKERFNALPGLTGLWQVSGKNRTTFNEMVDLDIYYARYCSLSLDLKILARTIWVIGAQIGELKQKRPTNLVCEKTS
ncbi:MAG: sugar transferase [Limisphaerales bacterium]